MRELLASDNSDGMLQIAEASRGGVRIPVTLFKTSVFAIELPDGSIPAVACMRFFHHLARREDRSLALRELHRVSSSDVIVSLWTDGCLQSFLRSRRRKNGEATAGYGKRTCIERAVFHDEIHEAGFEICSERRVWPGLSMWTYYHLRKKHGSGQEG